VRVIDASSAHRTAPGWTYGFAELWPGQAARIAAATRVSNPGCYPTGALALLRPLVDAGLLPADHPLSIHAVSGIRARGAQASTARSAGRRSAPALQVYGLACSTSMCPRSSTTPASAQRPFFVPAYGAFRQGIVLTCRCTCAAAGRHHGGARAARRAAGALRRRRPRAGDAAWRRPPR
jgi:N-acetyl-gamma-glutamyl-phosphate reductase